MSKNAALAIVAALCIVAAGVGAYLAVRVPVTRLAAPPEGVTAPPAATEPATAPSSEYAGTEGVIADPGVGSASTAPAPAEAPAVGLPAETPPAPAPSAEPAPAPAPARRERPVARPATPAPLPTPPAELPPVEPPVTAPPVSEPPATAGIPPVVETVPPVEALPPPVEPPPPSEPEFEELVVSADSVLGLQLLTTVSTETARVEDEVEARVTRDVRVGDRVAIPAGARMVGSVTLVERGGKMKERARLGVRFHTLVLADSTRLPVLTEAIYREGASPGKESAAKVGAAAAGGAILGAILGGGKGAAIGGAVGAAGGTAAVMAGGRNAAVLASGTAVTVRLQQPVAVAVAR